MDTREAVANLEEAKRLLTEKAGDAAKYTAAWYIIAAIESLVRNLDNSLGSTHKAKTK